MEGSRKIHAYYMAAAVVVTCMILFGESRKPELHRVGGGRYNWRVSPDINFTNWSLHEHFYVGDWLYFGFDKRVYNVLEVNMTSYERCIQRDFMKNVTRGGRDVFNLTEARPFYFISGRGYCFQGLKVAVNVQEAPPIQHSLHLANNVLSLYTFPQTVLVHLLLTASAWILNF